MMKNLFEKALSIEPPWFVKEIRFDEEQKQLDIFIDFERGATFTYEDEESGIQGEFKAYGTINKTWRHLNFFEHECHLHCRTPRIKTGDGKVRLITPSWAGLNSGFTLLLEAFILQLCSHMPVNTVSQIIGETDTKLWRLIEQYTDRGREETDWSKVNTVGMDETSRAKRHDYVTLFVDMDEKRTLHVAVGKGSETIKEFAGELAKRDIDPAKVKQVSCDMSPSFIKGVRENLPEAEITFDKFHILKVINDAVDEVRKAEAKENPLLKGQKYLVLKNRPNLTHKQQETLTSLEVPKLNLKTIRALHIRENFQAIYNAGSLLAFESLLRKWFWWATHSRLKPMRKAAHTIKRHWEGVINWKRSQIDNGLLEGLNSLVQAAKAKARGYRSPKNFKIIVYLLTGKLDFSKINPHFVRV